MTEEELIKEATSTVEWESITMIDRPLFVRAYLVGAELREKRIAELDCQMKRNKYCYSCVNATERCFKNEIGCPCEKYKSYKDENAELKARLNAINLLTPELEKQSKLKKQQLTKAKSVIKKFYDFVNNDIEYDPEHPEEHTKTWNELCTEAEQFLSEVEK